MGSKRRDCYLAETEKRLPGLVIVNTHDVDGTHTDAHYAAVLAVQSQPQCLRWHKNATITEIIDDQLFAYDAHPYDDNNSSKFQYSISDF